MKQPFVGVAFNGLPADTVEPTFPAEFSPSCSGCLDNASPSFVVLETDPHPGGTVRYRRLVSKDEACAKELKKRTLTNLYNHRTTWLDLTHKKLDEAVFAAYGWNPGMTDDDLLAGLLALNLKRAANEQQEES